MIDQKTEEPAWSIEFDRGVRNLLVVEDDEDQRKAIVDLFPAFESRYERIVKPHFLRVLQQRCAWRDIDAMGTSPQCLHDAS